MPEFNLYQYFDHFYTAFIEMPHHPLYLIGGLILITFLFEDVALAAGVSLSTMGSLSWGGSFLAIWFGIALGDFFLFLAGYYSGSIPFLKKYVVDKLPKGSKLESQRHLAIAIFIARVTPGLRLVTYVYMGLKRLCLVRFLAVVTLATFIWTACLYLASIYLGSIISDTFQVPQAIAVAFPLLLLAVMTAIFPWLCSQWRRANAE
jgi:membrane protein DedA with SNARE-associated domain